MTKTSPGRHLGYLDGMRAIAALFVVAHHAYLQVRGHVEMTRILGWALNIFSFGRYAVDVFIVLSGFCLMLPVSRGDGRVRNGALNFFKRRAWRILPPYYFALLFSWALASLLIHQKTGTHWDISIPVTTKSVLSHFLLLHDITLDDFTINHAFWSIAVEWRIYFLFPFLVWAWRSIGGVWTTLISIVISYLLYHALITRHLPSLTAYYVGLFVIGMMGANIAYSAKPTDEKLRQLPWGWITAAAAVAVIAVTPNPIHSIAVPSSIADEIVGVWTSCLLITLSRNPGGKLCQFFSAAPIVFLGTFAYSIYLIHAPILQVLWQYILVPLQTKPLQMFLALLVLGMPLIVAFSYGFYLLCERPFLSRQPKNPNSA